MGGNLPGAARSASLSRILTVVTETDAPFYGALLRTHDEHSVVVQPNNRGTAPGILYGLLRVARRAPYAPVIVLPSDHWVSDEATFMAHVDAAVAVVAERPELS